DVIEAETFDVLHHVEWLVVVLPDAEDRHDVGVVQPGGSLGLALEALNLSSVDERPGRQDLERDLPAEPFLLGLVDHAHSTAADLANDTEPWDRRKVDL